MSEPFLGEVRMFGGNFAPSGWALCNGQLMSIAQNSALFAILGTTYGGDGIQTFALPNFQGVVPMSWGQARSGSQYSIGQTGGSESVTLIMTQMPMHNHTVGVSNQGGTTVDPTNGFVAEINTGSPRQPTTTTPAFNSSATGTMAPNAVSIAGGSQPHENMQPFLAVSFIIALQGIFPSRS